jgi:hypothetical protein
MPHDIPAFALDPDENPGEPLEVPAAQARRLLGDIHKTTLYRLIRIGALRSFLDDNGERWVTMRSIRRFRRFQRERGPVGPRPRRGDVLAVYRQYWETPASRRRRRLPALREAAVPTEND